MTLPQHLTAIVTPTNIPGLVNVQVTTGETYTDLTVRQLQYLAHKGGWQLIPPGRIEAYP